LFAKKISIHDLLSNVRFVSAVVGKRIRDLAVEVLFFDLRFETA